MARCTNKIVVVYSKKRFIMMVSQSSGATGIREKDSSFILVEPTYVDRAKMYENV